MNFENIEGDFEKNMEIKSLEMKTPALQIVEAIWRLNEEFQTKDGILNINSLQKEKTENHLANNVKKYSSKPDSVTIKPAKLTESNNNSFQGEIREIIKLFRGAFVEAGKSNPAVLSLNTFEFEEFKQANLMAHKMCGMAGRVSNSEMKNVKKEFEGKVDNLITIYNAKGCNTLPLNELRDCSTKLFALHSKFELNSLQNKNNIKSGKGAKTEGISR